MSKPNWAMKLKRKKKDNQTEFILGKQRGFK